MITSINFKIEIKNNFYKNRNQSVFRLNQNKKRISNYRNVNDYKNKNNK